jgi:hypothetical protein
MGIWASKQRKGDELANSYFFLGWGIEMLDCCLEGSLAYCRLLTGQKNSVA